MTRWWAAFIGNKQVNGRALLILLLALVVGLGGTYLVHGFQVRRNAGGLLEQAGVTEGDGDKIQAIMYLQQYLGLMPGDRDATAKLALLLSQETKNRGALERAYQLYDGLLRRDDVDAADRRGFHLEAAKLSMRLRRYADAKQQLQDLVNESGADADTLQLQGLAEVGLGNDKEAEKFYDAATRKGNYQPETAVNHANLLRKLGRSSAKADSVIRDMLAHNKKSFAACLEAARYFRQTGQLQLAKEQLQSIVHDLGNPTEEVFLLAGNIERVLGDLEKARDLFDKGRQLNPASAALARGLAQVELAKNEPAKALALLEPSLRELPTDIIELWNLANLLIDAHAKSKARTVLDQLRKLHQNNAPALIYYTEARLRMGAGQWAEAARLLARARADTRFTGLIAVRANLLLAQCSDHLLNPDQKVDALRRALAQDPRNAAAGRELAQAQAAQGDLDSASERLRSLMAQGEPVKTELARVLLDRAWRANDQNLLKEAEQLLSEAPPAVRWYAPAAAAADFVFGLGPWQTAALLLLRPEALPATKDPVGIVLLKAELQLLQGKPVAEIRRLVEAERDRDPAQSGPWLFLVGLAQREKRDAQAFELLDQAEVRNGQHVEWPLMRVLLLLDAGPDIARKELPRLLAKVDALPAQEQPRLLTALANAFLAIDETKSASTLWKKIVDDDPSNLQAAFAYFESLLQLKDLASARGLLTKIKRIDGGEGAITAYGEGALRVSEARASQARGDRSMAGLTEAHAFFARAAKLRPTWAQVPLLEAAAYELEDQKPKALEKYRAALDLGEGRLGVVQRALRLMYELRQTGEAAALLAKITNKKALDTPEFGRLAAQITFQSAGVDGQNPKTARQQALAQARKVAANSNDYWDKLLLGKIASLTGDANDLAEAEKAFADACALKPTAPEAWRELILLLARTDPKRGAEALAKARQSLAKDDAALVLAVGLEAVGQLAKAEEQFETLRAAKPFDAVVLREAGSFFARHNKVDKAVSTLETLLDPTARADAKTRFWAQRSLALMLALQRDAKRIGEAEKLLAEADKSDPDSPEARLAKAQFLLLQKDRRADAIVAIERLQDAMPDAMRFALAQLYEAAGNWPSAERQLLILLRSDDKNPAYLDRYVSGLLRHHDLEAAQRWVDKLAQAAPKALHTLELRVQIALAAKQNSAAVKLVQEYADGKDARPELAARWFELVDKIDDAEKYYRAFVAASKKPESVLVLAQFLGRHKKAAEALAICDRAGPDCRLDAVARTRVTILRGGTAEKKQWQAVEDWLKSVIEKKKGQPNEALPLRFLLAELYEYSKRPNESIPVYREILKDNPKHVPALNNLAYVIALSPPYDTAEGLKLINQAIDIAGTNEELLDTRAVIYLKKQQPAMAMQDLRQAFGDNPSAVRYFHLAQARYQDKDKAGAADAWRKATDLGLQVSGIHPLELPTYELLGGQSKLGW